MATQYFNRFSTYIQMIRDAKAIARKSIVVDHCGSEFIDLKNEFNNIEQVYHIFREHQRGHNKLSLIEFKTREDADNVAQGGQHRDGLLPVRLNYFLYRGKNSNRLEYSKLGFPVTKAHLNYKRGLSTDVIKYSDLIHNNSMSIVGLKLRFMTLVNLEKILCSGLFEEYELLPYGSSVIDIGSDSGDLDLLFTRKVDHEKVIAEYQESLNQIRQRGTKLDSNQRHERVMNRISSSSSLTHLDKKLYQEPKCRDGLKGIMRLFDYILKEYTPLADSQTVLSIPHAKVPIIKFTSRITGIECDLSFDLQTEPSNSDDLRISNYDSIVISSILFKLCRNNNLFTSVVIYLRNYAKIQSITMKGSTHKFTNFQFLSLIIFYLQQIGIENLSKLEAGKSSDDKIETPNISKAIDTMTNSEDNQLDIKLVEKGSTRPILPPFQTLLDNSRFNIQDWSIELDEHQIDKLLPRIIEGFLLYYAKFDFKSKAINLYTGKTYRKPDNSTIYVNNPLDNTRNICHNVSNRGRDEFLKSISKSLNALEAKKSLLEHTKECQLTYIRQGAEKSDPDFPDMAQNMFN